MILLIIKNTANNTMHSVQEPQTFLRSFHFLQYFYCIPLLIHQLFLVYIYNFYNLNILLCHMIYHIHIHIHILKTDPFSHLSLSINYSPLSHLHLSSFHLRLLLQTLESNLHLHLQVSRYFMCLV